MILALETSCDDTCASVVTPEGKVLSNVVSSQHDIHEEFQGVVPELASRRHCEVINVVIRSALGGAEVGFDDLSAIAVTYGPGLIGSLLTGIAASKSVAARFDLPLIPVNHIDAHIYSILIDHPVPYPYISLVASGGHTALFLVESESDFSVLGHTMDDAVGEAYDKVAKMLDLGYPGGPEIEKTAREGDPSAYDFPRPTLTGSKRWSWRIENFDFSFSGIKTAVYYELQDDPEAPAADVAASFQRSVNDCLVYKSLEAAGQQGIDRICVGGGVAANGPLRSAFRERARESGQSVFFPSRKNCTDNAAMVGYRARMVEERADMALNARPNLSMYSPRGEKQERITE